jgi:Tfp pilus assembly protein PilF
LNDKLATTYLKRGLAYRQIGEREKARDNFKKVLELTKSPELSQQVEQQQLRQQAEQQLQELANN